MARFFPEAEILATDWHDWNADPHALGAWVAAIAGSPIWGPRAQMITFTFTCLELYWLRAYLDGRSRAIAYFPLVMIGWANLHGGWVIGFVWLGVALVAEPVERRRAVGAAHGDVAEGAFERLE